MTFSVPISKELDNGKTITYRLKFIIALDLCRPHYQVLLTIYLKKLKVISVEIVNPNLITYHLNIIN